MNCPLNPYRSQVPRLTLLSWDPDWPGYSRLHVKLTRILQKLRTSRIRWYCSFDTWAAAQQNRQYGLSSLSESLLRTHVVLMTWSGYIWLHVKLTRILQKLRTSRIRWYCSFDIWAAAQQNQQYGLCTQLRLRSAWASAQSDQSLRCQHGESLDPNSYPLSAQRRLRSDWANAKADLSICWVHILSCFRPHEESLGPNSYP